jgi:Protein of unknown function (DUF3293)
MVRRVRRVRRDAEDPWVAYARTVVEITVAHDEVLVVRPRPPGTIDVWPFEADDPVHVLTAWDPGDERPGTRTNRRRQAELEDELRTLAGQVWPSRGLDPQTGRRDEGAAVRGLPESTVLALGARYRQDAVFAWTPQAWSIVECRGTRREDSGWSLAVLRQT